jgi:hypothetical protein
MTTNMGCAGGMSNPDVRPFRGEYGVVLRAPKVKPFVQGSRNRWTFQALDISERIRKEPASYRFCFLCSADK